MGEERECKSFPIDLIYDALNVAKKKNNNNILKRYFFHTLTWLGNASTRYENNRFFHTYLI